MFSRSFAKERNVLVFFYGLCKRSLRSFPFFRKDCKRMERSFGSHKSPKTRKKNGKERNVPFKVQNVPFKERNILLGLISRHKLEKEQKRKERSF